MEPGRIYPDRSPFTVTHDRDVEFWWTRLMWTNPTPRPASRTSPRCSPAPRVRRRKGRAVFSKVAATAQSLDGYHSQTAAADFTKATVFGKLKSMLAAGKLRRYKAKGGLIMYVSSAIMDALEQSSSLPETSS